MRREVLAILVGLLVLGSVGAGYILNNSSSSTTTVTSTSVSTITPSPTTETLTVTETTVSGSITTTMTTTTVTTTEVTGPGPIPVSKVDIADYIIGDGPEGLVVDSGDNKAYIPDGSILYVVQMEPSSQVSQVQLQASAMSGTVNYGIALDPGTHSVYVSVQGGVAEVNGVTDTVVGEIPIALTQLQFNPTTSILYGIEGKPTLNGSLIGVQVRSGAVVANVSLGMSPEGIAVNSATDMIYSDGCIDRGLVCDPILALVNGTTGKLVTSVDLSKYFDGTYPDMAVDSNNGVVYVSTTSDLVMLNGATGDVISSFYDQACSPFLDMTVMPSSNEVLMVPQNYNYLLVYDGTSGTLENMYSFPDTPAFVAASPNSNELYVAADGEFYTFNNSYSYGNVNGTLVGAGSFCGLP